jgi:hypothetical protein
LPIIDCCIEFQVLVLLEAYPLWLPLWKTDVDVVKLQPEPYHPVVPDSKPGFVTRLTAAFVRTQTIHNKSDARPKLRKKALGCVPLTVRHTLRIVYISCFLKTGGGKKGFVCLFSYGSEAFFAVFLS